MLKLFPKPRSQATAIVAVADPHAALALLSFLRDRVGERVTTFELISRICLDLVFRHIPGTRDPFERGYRWYVLVELSDSTPGDMLATLFEQSLGDAAEAGRIEDGVIAASGNQRLDFWKLRESISEAQKLDGVSIKHDVSVPVSRVPELIERAGAELARTFPDVRIVAFGHLGDGNIHYNCSKGVRQEAKQFFAESAAVNHIVYEVVNALGGSISAGARPGRAQGGRDRALQERHRDGPDACDQAHPRPARHHEPGESPQGPGFAMKATMSSTASFSMPM